MREQSIIDISRLVSENTAVWPGDTPFSRVWVMSIAGGGSCNTSTFTLSAHVGTHTDAPCHFQDGASSLDQVPLHPYVGRCRVIHARHDDRVSLADLDGIDLAREERLLFRTPHPPRDDEWREDFAHVSVEVAEKAARSGVRLLGIDTPSVDPVGSRTLETHKTLLAGGVAILEGLDLEGVEEGSYQLIALPLRIAGADSSPVRAILCPWEPHP